MMVKHIFCYRSSWRIWEVALERMFNGLKGYLWKEKSIQFSFHEKTKNSYPTLVFLFNKIWELYSHKNTFLKKKLSDVSQQSMPPSLQLVKKLCILFLFDTSSAISKWSQNSQRFGIDLQNCSNVWVDEETSRRNWLSIFFFSLQGMI